MDGTFYLSNRVIEGAPSFIEALWDTGRDYRFFTNNSSNNVAVCREKLANMGFPVEEDRVIISSHVTIDYLNKTYPGKRVYLLGNERLTADFIAGGVVLDESWQENDGLVNTVSAMAPLGAPYTDFDPEEVEAGVWQIMPIYHGDHMSLQGGMMKRNNIRPFYLELLETIDVLPDN